MIPLPAAVSGTLTWLKLSCRSSELRLNGEVVGTLNRPSFWSEKYLAESHRGLLHDGGHHGQWTFRRAGFLCAGSEILETNSGQRIATYKSGWGGKGTLTFEDCRQTFHVQCDGLWRAVWTVSTEAGQPVLRLHVREKTVETTTDEMKAAVPESRLFLLILFACYCVLRAEEEAAAAVVVAPVS